LESYHPYLLPQEVSKTPITLDTYGSLPKIRKGRFGSLSPLAVNIHAHSLDQACMKTYKKISEKTRMVLYHVMKIIWGLIVENKGGVLLNMFVN
jgi:hypothetical protein